MDPDSQKREREREPPICPVCNRPAPPIETRHGILHECHGLRSWNYKPLAPIATLRARAFAHAAFDPLWKGPTRIMPRTRAYKKLAKELGMDRSLCHIGLMSEEDARRVPAAVKRIRAAARE